MSPLKFITRDQWCARPPKSTVPMVHPILFVGFSYVEVRDIFDIEIVKQVQRLHMDVKEYSDIECSFVIGRNGSIYVGRGWFTQPEIHNPEAEGGNYLDIGFIGQTKGRRKNDPALKAMIDLLQFGIDNKYLDEDYAIMGNQGEDKSSDDSTELI